MSPDSGKSTVLRKHVTIMFTDIVGYTALMGSDEDRAFEILRKNRAIHQDLSKKYGGELIKEMGDGMLLSFNMAALYAFTGNKEKAFEELHNMENEKNLEYWMLRWMNYDPRFESIRNEKEFNAIIQRQKKRYEEIRTHIDELEKTGVI